MNKSFVTEVQIQQESYAGVTHASVTIKNMQTTNIEEEQYRHYSIFFENISEPKHAPRLDRWLASR